jgi:hypothetical protein
MPTTKLNAADPYAGINSKASKVVDDAAEGPRPTGYAAYRATVRSDSMRTDPDTAWLLEKPNINMWFVSQGQLLVCRGLTLFLGSETTSMR